MATKTKNKMSLETFKRAIDSSPKQIFSTDITSNKLYLYKMHQGKQIVVIIKRSETKKGMFDIDLETPIISKRSHFTCKKSETVFPKGKVIHKTIERAFKRMELWHLINKNFLIVNPNYNYKNNKKGKSEDQVKKEFKDMMKQY